MASCLKEPAAEARRIAAVKMAIQRGHQPWLRGAFFGNVSPAGYRARSMNGLKSGAWSLALSFACRYADAVTGALAARITDNKVSGP